MFISMNPTAKEAAQKEGFMKVSRFEFLFFVFAKVSRNREKNIMNTLMENELNGLRNSESIS